MNNSKETTTKKQSDELASNLNNLPWGLPLTFPSMPSFASFPPLGLPTSNFSMLNNFSPLSLASMMSNSSSNSSTTVNPWSNSLNNFDYNEYTKQLGLLMNAFHEQTPPQIDQTNGKNMPNASDKSFKSKRVDPGNQSCSSSSDSVLSKISSSESKRNDRSHHNSTQRSSNPNKSSRSKHKNNNVKTSTESDSNTLDSLSFTSTASSSTNPTFPYFLPPLLSQTSSSTTGTNNNLSSMTYPFSNLSSSLLNPAANLYSFLSPDWFSTSSSKLLETFTNLPANKSRDSKESTSQQGVSQSKHLDKHQPTESKSSTNDSSSISKIKKRAKSIRVLTEEQNPNVDKNVQQCLTSTTNIDSNRATHQSIDESHSNGDDDSDPNPKRKKFEEVNETLVRFPLSIGWKRVTIIRAITRTGVRGDVSYFAPCRRKLRSFQEIDRYLLKRKISNLDRSNFTFSSKVHIGHFHEPKETVDGKTIFEEFTDEQIIRRILEINPKFRPIRNDYEIETQSKSSTVSSPSMTPNHTNGFHHQSILEESRVVRFEHEDATSKKTNDLLRSFRTGSTENIKSSYSHNSFLQAMIEQQKFHQEQQEQERKRQELHYIKQIEVKKRQEERLILLEQRKAEKTAQREKKIQEKYTEIVLAKEKKRIVEDMQIRELKELPNLTRVETLRLSNDAFANALMIIEFLNNFKDILHLAEHLIPTLNSFQQLTSRDINSLCQILLRRALEDPGIPNPKKGLTSLGQKLSEIDITEHTFSEILRLYIRERNGFDEKISQSLSDVSFQSLTMDDKIEILAFLCQDLSTSKRIVEETDRHLDELIVLKHEKLEIDKRLRRLKFDKANQANGNNVKKLAALIREKDLNSSENESPNESDTESMKIDLDVNSSNFDQQDLETIDEMKIDDLDKRLELLSKKYNRIKRRVISKQCRTRALHLGQDRYRRRYWYFSHIPGIYVEGLRTGDVSSDEVKEMVDYVTKQRLDKKFDTINGENHVPSRSTARKRPQSKANHTIISSVGPSTTTIETSKVENEEETITIAMPSNSVAEDLTTMDLSAFCLPAQHNSDDENMKETTTLNPIDPATISNDSLPLDLSCSKMKRVCQQEYWISSQPQSTNNFPLSQNLYDSSGEVHQSSHSTSFDLSLSKIKQENLLDLTNSSPIKHEPSGNNLKQIEQNIREKFQYPQPLPIPDDIQTGWWIISSSNELRSLMKCLTRRGQRERYLCRMLQRYFDVLVNSISTTSSIDQDVEHDHDDHQASSSNDFLEQEQYDDTHEMDVLNEIYNLSDRIITASLHCQSYDVNISRSRLTYADIQSKGSDVLDEAKHLLIDVERHIERRYLKHPFVRKYDLNLLSTNRSQQTSENSNSDDTSSSIYDEVPQQLERWRRTINESRTPAQLALCLTQLERCIAWERSIMKVYCEICNCDDNEEKLLLCDGCDRGTHTYCFRPPMSSIPPNDWYCYVCIGKSKCENLCFVCGNNVDSSFMRCEQCGKSFHDYCLKNAKQQHGKWFCALCSTTHDSTLSNNSATSTTNVNMKTSSSGRQTLRSTNIRQSSGSSNNCTTSQSNDDSACQSSSNNSRSRSACQRKSKSLNNEESSLQETEINVSPMSEISASRHVKVSTEENLVSSTKSETNSKKKSKRSSKTSKDLKACRIITN